MKNLLIFLLAIMSISAFGQTVLNCKKNGIDPCGTGWDPGPLHTYSFSIRNSSLVNTCSSSPGNPTTGTNFSNCMIKWTLTNGTFFGSGSSTKEGLGLTDVTDVVWNNVSGNGTLKFEILDNACAPCNSLSGINKTNQIVKPINYLGSIGNLSYSGPLGTGTAVSSFSINCGVNPITLSVSSVTGGNTYDWIVPSGWTKSGSGNTITVTPSLNTGGYIYLTVKRTDNSLQVERNWYVSRPVPTNYGTIQGGDIICNSGTNSSQTYTVTGLPAGATVSHWSSNFRVSINSSTGVATSAITTSGPGKIYAHISHPCGNAIIEKDVWVGVPIITIIGNEVLCPGFMTTYQAVNELDMTNSSFTCSWSTSSSYLWNSAGNSTIESVSASMPGTYYLYNTSYNICGASLSGSLGIVVPSGAGCEPHLPSSLSKETTIVYPNPASSTVFINVDESENDYVGYTIIAENSLNIIKKGNLSKVNNEIDVSQFPKGKYFIHINMNEKILKRIIEIK